MGRGLDGLFDIRSLALCSFEGPRGGDEACGFVVGEISDFSPRKPRERFGPVSADFRWLWRGGNTSSHSEQSS